MVSNEKYILKTHPRAKEMLNFLINNQHSITKAEEEFNLTSHDMQSFLVDLRDVGYIRTIGAMQLPVIRILEVTLAGKKFAMS